MKTRFTHLLVITLILSLLTGQRIARADDNPVAAPFESTSTSAFTYQGQVMQNNQPVNGACGFQFNLWDAVTDGNQIGSLLTIDNVLVINGLFTVSLDFGDVFDGNSRWLKMAVSCPSGGSFTLVTPRQQLMAVPYASHAISAPWSGLTGIPAGFADGVDNDTLYTAGFGLTLSGTQFTVTGAPWSGLTGIPAGFADGIDNDTLYTAGPGLILTNTLFSLAFAGSGSANTAARSDHNHNGIYALITHTHAGEDITSGTVADVRIASSLTRDSEVLGIVLASDGSGSGLDADQLDGQQGSFFQNASNINAGLLSPVYYSAYTDLAAEGYLDLSADGDLLTRNQGDNRYVNEGQADSVTSGMIVNGTVTASDLQDGAALAEISNNDGAGSGLDADLLDGQHGSAYTYSAGDGLTLANNQFSMQGTSYQQVVVVAKSGGDFTTIQAALDSITDASATKRYLVWVAPGIYTERVTMKQYVDIEGANTTLTRITYGGSPTLNTGTVIAASNAELRFLTVENTGANIYGVGIYNVSTSYFYLFKAQVTVSGAAQHYAIYISNASNSTYTNSAITATGEQGDVNYGIYNNSSSVTVQYSQVNALIGTSNYGIYNQGTSGSYTVVVRDSQISGSTATLRNDTAFTTRIAVSQLNGGAVSGSGITCAGVYDENYAFSTSTCP